MQTSKRTDKRTEMQKNNGVDKHKDKELLKRTGEGTNTQTEMYKQTE